MSASESSSALLQLPRELSDEIYGHCVDRSYVVFWYYVPGFDYSRNLADLAILRTSKAISSDAKQLIFSTAASKATTFVFDFGFDHAMKFTAPPTKDATNSMMNVKFNVELHNAGMQIRADDRYHESETSFSMKSICEATIDRFADTMVVRDSFRIRFRPAGGGFLEDLASLMETSFFQSLKRFNGFRNLAVELYWRDLRSQRAIADPEQGVRALQVGLEPSLGPSVIESLVEDVESRCDLTLVLKFHPLKFHVEKLRAEAAKLTKEADMLEG